MLFRPLRTEDLPVLHGWLSRPHIVEWFGEPPTLVEVERDYLPSIAGNVPHHCYFAIEAGTPVGFIQSYTPAGWHHEGWWLEEHDPGVRGIDQFVADAGRLGQGLGTRMVRSFVAQLFEDQSVTRVQTDPSPENRRAIRCYEKADFRAVKEIETPDGRALLMYCDRNRSEKTEDRYQPIP
ncbi:MAG: GNAT family N-acetyltransferase [Gemmatimonadaceae bacterium]